MVEKPLKVSPEYTLIRSNRKTLALEIGRGQEVLVRAPRRCPQREIDRFVTEHTNWLASHLEKQRRRAEAYPEPTEAERQALILRAKTELPARVARRAETMGLVPSRVTITGAEKRFGSCSAKNRLCFSWRLMRYSDEAIDYVVVHELAHIVHKNHGREFYALIASVLPDWKARQKLLKE
jgi:predicted metal-dependent hydrolase